VGSGLTIRMVVDGIAQTVALRWTHWQAHFAPPLPAFVAPPRDPHVALLVWILFGLRDDGPGISVPGGPGRPPVPPGPPPYRETLADALTALAGATQAWSIHDPKVRVALQLEALKGASASVDRLARALSEG
jgi:hypothetical protein